MAGPVTSEERVLVSRLGERFREELALRQREGRWHPCFFGETALCRILRGNHGELEKSVAWFERFLEKMVEYEVDDLLRELMGKLKDGTESEPAILPHYDEVCKYFRMVFQAPKCSPDGDLVQYMALVDFDKYGILECLDWDHWVRFARASILLLCLRLEQMSCSKRRMVKCVLIVDLAGCNMDSAICSTFDHANDRDVSKMLEEIAAEIVSEVYVVNASWTVTTLFNTFKGFIPQPFAAKCKFPHGDGLDDQSFVERAGGKEQLKYFYSTRVGLVTTANRTISPPHELDSLPTEKEKLQIAKLRERFQEAFSLREQAGLLHPCFFGDLAIARVLRGNDGSLSMAIKWFERFLDKANQYNVDRHYEYVMQRLDASGSQYGNLTMLPYYEEVQDYFRMVFTAPKPNPKGDVVQYLAISDIDRQGILDNVDWQHWVAFMRSYMILRCIEAERLSQLRKRMVRCISIFDLEDSGVGIKGMPGLPDFDERQNRDVFEFMQNICAEILGSNYVLNAPWVMVKAYNWFSNFVPEKLSQKLRIMDGDGSRNSAFLNDIGGEQQLKHLLQTRVGLTCGQKDEPAGVRDIPPGQDFQKTREVSAGQRVSWSCEVLANFADGLLGASSVDFGVTAYWLGDDSGTKVHRQPVQEIIPTQTIDVKKGRITGSCKSDGNGVISFTWSNTSTMLRTKTIRYRLSVTDGDEHEDPLGSAERASFVSPVPMTLQAESQGSLFQFYRFTPTKMRSSMMRNSRHGDFCQLCALHFQHHGTPLLMSQATVTNPGGRNLPGDGPEHLVDGKLSTKWADAHRGAVVLKFPSPVLVDAISFTTAADMPECDPLCWILEGSRNGSSWTLLHSQARPFPMPTARLESSVWLRLASADMNMGASSSRSASTFNVFRFTPLRLRYDEAERVKVSEVKFRTTTGSIISTADAVVSNPGGLHEKGCGAWHVIDGQKQTCWADQNKMGLLVQFPHYMKLEEFCFSTAQDEPECDPIHWILEGAEMGGTWSLLVSSLDEHSVPLRRGSSTVWFPMLPARDARDEGRCSATHLWVTRQQFEEQLRCVPFLSWQDFSLAAGLGTLQAAKPRGALWLAGFLFNLFLWLSLAALGWNERPAAALAIAAFYCMAVFTAVERGWLPAGAKQLVFGTWT